MEVTTTFKFHFDVNGRVYDFAIDAETLDEAKRILAEDLKIMGLELAP